jgi:hypothetical protein
MPSPEQRGVGLGLQMSLIREKEIMIRFPRGLLLGSWVNEKAPACYKNFVTKSLPTRYLLAT